MWSSRLYWHAWRKNSEIEKTNNKGQQSSHIGKKRQSGRRMMARKSPLRIKGNQWYILLSRLIEMIFFSIFAIKQAPQEILVQILDAMDLSLCLLGSNKFKKENASLSDLCYKKYKTEHYHHYFYHSFCKTGGVGRIRTSGLQRPRLASYQARQRPLFFFRRKFPCRSAILI